jgi:RNA-binding protein NOB1
LLTTVKAFARETGDIHALSAVDMKLIALTHMLETQLHGPARIRDHAAQVRAAPHAHTHA